MPRTENRNAPYANFHRHLHAVPSPPYPPSFSRIPFSPCPLLVLTFECIRTPDLILS
ncbi:MAG: hypothetical protein JNJ65_15210 [Cyclobacteriaceae bacterium]|nr:hypothetical protein [Cyclobacteriaceae bacterium]